MKALSFLLRPVAAGLFWGLIGGISLIAIPFFTTKGLVQILPIPIILIAAILFVKFYDTSERTFRNMFLIGFLSFMVMSIILSVYVLVFENPVFNISLANQGRSLGMMIVLAVTCSFLLSFIAKPVLKKSI